MVLAKAGWSVLGRAARWSVGVLVAMFMVAHAQPAHAQPAHAQPAAYDEAQYQRAINQALDEFERGNWDEAEGLFAQAHRISPNARTLRGMGISAFEARRYVRALEHLQAALQSSVNPLSNPQRAEVEDAIARAEGYVATIEVSVEPASAEVRVNGVLLAPGVRVVRVDPGLVQAQANAPAFSPMARELRVAAGERAQLALHLVPERSAPTLAQMSAGTTQREAPHEPPPPRKPAPAPSHGPEFHAWKWLALGTGVLLLAGGGIAHGHRELTAADYNKDEPCLVVEEGMQTPSRCRGMRQQMRDAELLAAIGYSAGALLVGGAIAMFVLEGGADRPAQASGCRVDVGAVRCLVHF